MSLFLNKFILALIQPRLLICRGHGGFARGSAGAHGWVGNRHHVHGQPEGARSAPRPCPNLFRGKGYVSDQIIDDLSNDTELAFLIHFAILTVLSWRPANRRPIPTTWTWIGSASTGIASRARDVCTTTQGQSTPSTASALAWLSWPKRASRHRGSAIASAHTDFIKVGISKGHNKRPRLQEIATQSMASVKCINHHAFPLLMLYVRLTSATVTIIVTLIMKACKMVENEWPLR